MPGTIKALGVHRLPEMAETTSVGSGSTAGAVSTGACSTGLVAGTVSVVATTDSFEPVPPLG